MVAITVTIVRFLDFVIWCSESNTMFRKMELFPEEAGNTYAVGYVTEQP
jgi:hypothetical protein